MEYTKRIVSSPDIMLGKPVIKGTRITVELILRKMAEGMTIEELLGALYTHYKRRHTCCCFLFCRCYIQRGINCTIKLSLMKT